MRFFILSCLIFIFLSLPVSAADKEFGGIGAQVVPTATGEIVVLQLVDGSPAAQKGLLPGDLIVSINGKPLKGLDFNTVTRDYLWGFVGESVEVTWLRPGEVDKRSADLVRVKIDAESLRHPGVKMLKPE
ncbi:MAG: hypothetical protein C0615_01215 [Desulfuromonas sp.]|nr:MAG: hypothetical protein C0615_01215 [Desulfuromonas sp.]